MIEGYYLSERHQDMQFKAIHSFISTTYWAEGIPSKTMSKAMENSMCFGVFLNNTEQVGFARVVTDKATFAYLCDVYIEKAHRGKGLAKWLMEFIHHHSVISSLRRTILVTRDAHHLYAQYGFTELSNPDGYMEKWQPNVYKNN